MNQNISSNEVYDAQSTALASDGKTAINTVKVYSAMTAENILVMTLENTTNQDVQKLPIMPGTFTCGAAAKLPTGVEGSVQGYESFEAAIQHLTFNSTQVRGLEMTSAVTENLDNTFTFEKKRPSGQSTVVPRPTEAYMTYMGDGKFTPKVNLPEKEWTFLLDRRQRIELGHLKAKSKVTIRFKVFGEEGVTELMPFETARL